MSDSITPFGTTRSVFSLATNDLEINGDIIASKFVGSGDKLTNITIKSINESTFNNNYVLDQTLGGTGSSTFIDKGILFNNETFRTLESTPNFIWDNVENTLFINNKDIIKDYSNYILETAEVLGSNIESTSNNVISQIINHIENDIRIYNVSGIPKTSTSNYGLVKVGEGLFVDDNGVITIKPQDIVIQRPDVEPELTPNNIPDTNYERFVFKYDPDRGTTFDNNASGSRNTVLPYWFNFDSKKINNSSNIQSTGAIQTNALIINNNTDVLIKVAEELKYEYTPLNNNYLYFNGTENSYAYFDSSIDFYDIFNNVKEIGGTSIGITFSFWFKIEEKAPQKGSVIFLGGATNSYLLEIDIILDKPADEYNKLSLRIFNLSEFKHILSTNIELYKWYHLVWTIGGNGIWSIHLNNVKETNIVYNSRAVIEASSRYVVKNIGRSRTSQTSFKFSLSDLRIYNRVLTDVEITELYCANIYTEYKLFFNDPNYTKCDILLIGGGGGGTNEGGGGAGELVYIDNATMDKKTVVVKVGRGGAGKVIKNINNVDVVVQENTKGIDTVFGLLNINGGGSYNIALGAGGSGAGNGGISQLTTNFNNFITAASMYHKGKAGYILNGGGGGSDTAGGEINGGAGLNAIKDGTTELFNFKTIFSLSNDNKESYYDAIAGSNYFAGGGASNIENALGGIGGGGGGSYVYNENIIYNGLDNTGSGGGGYFNHGFSGGSGVVILRFLNKEILNTGVKNDIIQTCNYIISLNNSISAKVNNLNTDNIAEYVGNNNKFIVNNVYNNDLLLNGTLTVASDLLVLGNTTTLQTDIYTTEKIEITNYDSDTALRVNQIGGNIGDKKEVMTVLYNFNKLLTVINNGCVGIGTVPQTDGNLLEVKGNINIITNNENNHKYTINNRDIISETSNFILAVSNYLNTDYDRIFDNTTNYILRTSNVIKTDYDTRFANTTNYILAVSNYLNTDYDRIFDNTTNYILATSNVIKTDYDTRFANTTNYILAVSNYLNTDYDRIFDNTTNYILATSNVIKTDYDTRFANTTNYILAVSNYPVSYTHLTLPTKRIV